MGQFSCIECLKVGEIELTKAELTYNVGFTERVKAPIFVFLIWSSANRSNPVLIDAGYNPPATKESGFWARGGPSRLRAALIRAHVQPDDIKTLVLTHLHIDHASFVPLFKAARIFLQSRELSFAQDPLPTQKAFYVAKTVRYLEKADIELVRGDKEIIDGLKLTSTPGHTPGSQIVSVDLGETTYTICGDTVPMYHNWYPKDRWGTSVSLPRIPPGVHTDLGAWFNSVSKIEDISDVVIPSHDPALADGTKFLIKGRE